MRRPGSLLLTSLCVFLAYLFRSGLTAASTNDFDGQLRDALGRLVEYDWLVTSNDDAKRQTLYEIVLKPNQSSAYCGSIQDEPVGVCRLAVTAGTTKETAGAVPTAIGFKSRFELKGINDGQLLVQNGSSCKDGATFQTLIYFHCGKTLGVPRVVSEDECVTVLEWDTNQVCKAGTLQTANEIPCFLTLTDDHAGSTAADHYKYMTVDFTSLQRTDKTTNNKLHRVIEYDPDLDVSINVCRYGNSLQDKCLSDYAGCVTMRDGSYLSFGFKSDNSTRLAKVAQGKYQLVYELAKASRDSMCPQTGPTPKMTINFICPNTRAGSKSPILQSFDLKSCNYDIDWYTQYACGMHSIVEKKNVCALSDPQRGIDVDLSDLSRPSGYQVDYFDGGASYRFLFNVCGPLSGHSECETGPVGQTSACQLKPSDPTFGKGAGSYLNSRLSFSDNELTLTMDGGQPCGTKLARKTVIRFLCLEETSDGSTVGPSFVYESGCVYYFEWKTRHACVLDCSLQVDKSLYDLSRLIKQDGSFWTPRLGTDQTANYSSVIFNVCNGLNVAALSNSSSVDGFAKIKSMKERCQGASSICAFDDRTKQATSLGSFKSDLAFDATQNALRLVYTGGDVCNPATNERKSTVLTFICDLNAVNYAGMDTPQLTRVSDDQCITEIVWRTQEACMKTRLVSTTADCLIDGGLNHEIFFNLSALAASSEHFEADHDHVFDDEDDEDDNELSKRRYAFQICGRRLDSFARPYLTFWDLDTDDKSSFQFAEPPQLVYDDGLLYFKYENRTQNRFALVKLECSYEEGISTNSQDLSALRSRAGSLVRLDSNSSLALVLWKTSHACLRGTNSLSAHFESQDPTRANRPRLSEAETCVLPVRDSSFGQLDSAGFLDLRTLLKKFHADERDLVVAAPFANLSHSSSAAQFHTRLCTTSLKCSSNGVSYGCLVVDGERQVNLGSRLNSSSVVAGRFVRYSFVDGSECPFGDKQKYSFEIELKCFAKRELPLTFIRQSDNGCRYHFEWLTHEACQLASAGAEPASKAKACRLNDPFVDSDVDLDNYYDSFTYDMSPLSTDVFSVSTPFDAGRSVLTFSICKPLSCGNGSDLVSSCLTPGSGAARSQGATSDELVLENGVLSLTYSSGLKCSPDAQNASSSTRLEFYCDYLDEFETASTSTSNRAKYLYFDRSSCRHVIALYTYLACPPYLSRQNIDFKCQISFDPTGKDAARLNTASAAAVNSLAVLFAGEQSTFALRFSNYRLVFRVCGLLPDAKSTLPAPSSSSHTSASAARNATLRPGFGRCFDRYGFAYASACLYNESVIEYENESGESVVKQLRLGVAKGPFVKSAVESVDGGSVNKTIYRLAYSPGDVCEQDRSRLMSFNVLFVCLKNTYTRQYTNPKTARVSLMSSSEQCVFNFEVSMKSFCEEAETLERLTVQKRTAMLDGAKSSEGRKPDPLSDAFCVFNQSLSETSFRIYNLSALASQAFFSTSFDGQPIKFRLCQNLDKANICSRNAASAALCLKDCPLAEANDQIELIEDGYRVRLTYTPSTSSAVGCGSRFSASARHVVDLVCDPKSVEMTVTTTYLSDNGTYVEMATKHACPTTNFVETDHASINSCDYFPFVVNSVYFDDFSSALKANLSATTVVESGSEYDEQAKIRAGAVNFAETEPLSTQMKPLSSYSRQNSELEFLFSFCSGLKSGLHSGCPNGSAVCVLDHSKEPATATSLGSLRRQSASSNNNNNKFYYWRNSRKNANYLVFEEGSYCRSGLFYSAQITLVCKRAEDEELNAPVYVWHDESACRYYFDWATPYACTGADAVDSGADSTPDPAAGVNECKIYNKLHNYTFDLSHLYKNVSLDDPSTVAIRSANYEYRVNICAPKSRLAFKNDSDVVVSRRVIIGGGGGGRSIPFGYFNQMTINHFANHLTVTYVGEKCPSGASDMYKQRNAMFVFECSPFSDMSPSVELEEECFVMIRWPLRAACVPMLVDKEQTACSLYYGGSVYDLKPLSHTFDSWKIDEANSSSVKYWLNVCAGIKVGPGDEQRCPRNATVCSLDQTTQTVQTLAFLSQMHLRMRTDGTVLEMVFNNTQQPCYSRSSLSKSQLLQSYTLVYIQFQCGYTMGKPEINDKFDSMSDDDKAAFLAASNSQCVLALTWKTRYACKNATKSLATVSVSNGIVRDDDIELDMRDILVNAAAGFVDASNPDDNAYFIKFTGNNTQYPENNANCTSSTVVCQVDEARKQFRDLGSQIESYYFDAYSEIFEIYLKSNSSKCSGSDGSKSVESLIRFYCDSSTAGNEYNRSFNFETQSANCFYIFDWPTRKLCVKNKWLSNEQSAATSTTLSTTPSNGNATSTTTPTSSTSSQQPESSTTTENHDESHLYVRGVPTFIIFALILVVLVLLLLAFNHRERIGAKLSKAYESCASTLGRVSWFGTSSPRLNHLSMKSWSEQRNGHARSNIRGIRYSRLSSRKTKHFSGLENEDGAERETSDDEVTAMLFEDEQETATVKLSDLSMSAVRKPAPPPSQPKRTFKSAKNGRTFDGILNDKILDTNLSEELMVPAVEFSSSSSSSSSKPSTSRPHDNNNYSPSNNGQLARRGSNNNILSYVENSDDDMLDF